MKKTILLILSIFIWVYSYSQNDTQTNYGQVSGNFQSEAQYYITDSLIGAIAPIEKTLANSWANISYNLGNFSAGIRYEGYLNSILGYPNSGGKNDGVGFPHRWASFAVDKFEITLGNFYEQFGNGLVLRSYEEKMLGVDNSLDGFRIKYNLTNGVYLKGLLGKQRYYWEHGPGIVRGFDGEIQFNELIEKFAESSLRISLGGSFVSKFQKEESPIYNLPKNIAASAGRIDIRYNGFALNSEYAYKINDPSADNDYIYKNGQAFMVNASYSQKGLGVVLSTKWVDNMSFRSDRNASLTDLNINLLPELTRNHVYMLPAFYPYASQVKGEWGSKAEITYKIPKGSLLGGKYGTTIMLNYSRVHNIDKQAVNDSLPLDAPGTLGYKTSFFSIGEELYFQDANIEINKRWNKKLYSNFSYVNLIYNYNILRGTTGYENVNAHIAIADITYKFKPQLALKSEIQHMYTKQDEGSWAMALFEFTIPNWFFTVLDNWNYGNLNENHRPHYFNFGFGHISGGTRIQLTYGKTRAGVMCVGGVCRNVPASNGVSLSISSTF
ncbi:MAG: hypothetical protein GX793_03970 [Bacteroidales bacterium]|jgi:hypothetical protein|nr:DUF6029 family protein [Bacteroidales bacterium]MDY0315805.1 DUF6029 family protein [Bacteroidales bacterium]NLB86201.1 hypothetical protein [Bacteroidales bacterium]